MSRETIVFQPAKNPRLTGSLKPVTAEKTSYGLVIHQTIQSGPHRKHGYWDVSDPETGFLVSYGLYPGREGAIASLVVTARPYGKRPGGFRRALEVAREKTIRKIACEQAVSEAAQIVDNPVQSGLDCTTSGAIGQP